MDGADICGHRSERQHHTRSACGDARRGSVGDLPGAAGPADRVHSERRPSDACLRPRTVLGLQTVEMSELRLQRPRARRLPQQPLGVGAENHPGRALRQGHGRPPLSHAGDMRRSPPGQRSGQAARMPGLHAQRPGHSATQCPVWRGANGVMHVPDLLTTVLAQFPDWLIVMPNAIPVSSSGPKRAWYNTCTTPVRALPVTPILETQTYADMLRSCTPSPGTSMSGSEREGSGLERWTAGNGANEELMKLATSICKNG
jgi:hypothetical protein